MKTFGPSILFFRGFELCSFFVINTDQNFSMATGDFLHYKVASPSFKFMGLLVGINPRLSSRLVEDWYLLTLFYLVSIFSSFLFTNPPQRFSGSSVEYKGTTFGMGFLKARRLIGSIGTRYAPQSLNGALVSRGLEIFNVSLFSKMEVEISKLTILYLVKILSMVARSS